MTRSFHFHPLSALVALGFGAVCVVSMAQVPATASGDPWPPAKKNIVNIFEMPSVPVVLPSGGTHVVYTVPSDRWLTVTGAAVAWNTSAFWAEDLNGTLTRKGLAVEYLPHSDGAASILSLSPAESGGPLGWTFRPGSQVVLENPSVVDVTFVRYSLIGYLSRQ